MFEIELYSKDVKDRNSNGFKKNIPTVSGMSYSEFFYEYLWKNQPCIISSVTEKWGATAHWINKNAPDFESLARDYGLCSVPVVECDLDMNATCEKRMMLFSDYINYWNKINDSQSVAPISYLKDWHLRRNRPTDNFYTVPEYFSSDWLNEYSLDKNIDDFMFVYMGPKGSWTSFHADVYSSFSWSANVIGKKRWLLFPPGEELKFTNSFGDISSNVESQLSGEHKYYEIIQNSGDAIFVPSGWFHQVQNLEDTISINHNWINSCNIHFMWNALKENLSLVEKEILEYKNTTGWSEHCQLMLKASFGINIGEFKDFIIHIARKRLKSLVDGSLVQFEQWHFGKNHILHDLKSICTLLEEIISENKFQYINESGDIEGIIKDVKNILRSE